MATNSILPIESAPVSQITPLPFNAISRSASQLQARQDQAIQQVDALEDVLARTQVLPENQGFLDSIGNDVRSQIEQIASQNDGFLGDRATQRQIRALARQTELRARPLLTQQANVSKALGALQDNDSFLQSDRARRAALVRSNQLRQLEDGSIDPGSVFQGRTFADRADINEIIRKQVNDIAANTSQSGLQLDPTTGKLVSTRGKTVSPRRVRDVALAAVMNSPEAMAFVQDEMELATFEKGEPLTAEEQQKIFSDIVRGSVDNAVRTFSFSDITHSFTNPVSGGSSSDASDELPTAISPFGEIHIPAITNVQAVSDQFGSQIASLETQLANNPLKDDQSNRFERQQVQNQITALQSKKQEADSLIKTVLQKNPNLTEEELVRLDAERPKPPPNLTAGRISRLQNIAIQRAKVNNNLAQESSFNPGFGGGSTSGTASALGAVADFVRFSEEERQYIEDFGNFAVTHDNVEISKVQDIEKAVADLQKNRQSFNPDATTIPRGAKTNKVAEQISQVVKAGATGRGFTFLDIDGQPLDQEDIPTELSEIGRLSPVPFNVSFRLEVRDKNDDKKDEERNLFIDIPMESDYAKLLGQDLMKGVSLVPPRNPNGTLAHEDDRVTRKRNAGLNLKYPNIINTLNTMPVGASTTDLGVNSSLLFIDGVQYAAKKRDAEAMEIVRADDNVTPLTTSSGVAAVFPNPQSASNFLAALAERRFNSGGF